LHRNEPTSHLGDSRRTEVSAPRPVFPELTEIRHCLDANLRSSIVRHGHGQTKWKNKGVRCTAQRDNCLISRTPTSLQLERPRKPQMNESKAAMRRQRNKSTSYLFKHNGVRCKTLSFFHLKANIQSHHIMCDKAQQKVSLAVHILLFRLPSNNLDFLMITQALGRV